MAEVMSMELVKSRGKQKKNCDPCRVVKGRQILKVKGFCENCSKNLCQNCVSAHKRNKLTRNHQIQDKPGVHHKMPPIKRKIQDQAGIPQKPTNKKKKYVTEKCYQQVLRSYCRSSDQLGCKIDKHIYSKQSPTNTAVANINDSILLKDRKKPFKKIKTIHNDNLSKAATQSLNIGKLHKDFKTPVLIKNIDHISSIRSSIKLPNQQLLLTEMYRGVKLLDLKQETIVSELKLPYLLWDVTQTKADEFAVACCQDTKIQFVSLTSDKLSKGRVMTVEGQCCGLEFNDYQNNLIATYHNPPKVEILSLTGTVIKRFENNATGNKLFTSPDYVAMSHDKAMIYVTDSMQHSVTLVTLNGEVKTIFKHESLQVPKGVCVNRSGIVYVVGFNSHTVHQIVPGRDKLEPLMDKTNGLRNPITISYCDVEDILYVGQVAFNRLKIFKMR